MKHCSFPLLIFKDKKVYRRPRPSPDLITLEVSLFKAHTTNRSDRVESGYSTEMADMINVDALFYFDSRFCTALVRADRLRARLFGSVIFPRWRESIRDATFSLSHFQE